MYQKEQTITLTCVTIRGVMREKREKWMELAAQVADEQDPEKLSKLISELARLLDEKQARLIREATPPKRSE